MEKWVRVLANIFFAWIFVASLPTYRELTNHSNKFPVTFLGRWGIIGPSGCTMPKSPPLHVCEARYTEDVATM